MAAGRLKRELTELEERLRDAGYTLRYERGHFRAGHCLVHERRVVVVNRFFDTPARLEKLRELSRELGLDPAPASEPNPATDAAPSAS